MTFSLKPFLEVDALAPARILRQEPAYPLPSPVLAYAGQDLWPLMDGIRGASIDIGDNALLAPGVELRLFTVENGAFFIGGGLDGTIVTEDGQPIHQTAAFRTRHDIRPGEEATVEVADTYRLGEVFIGFDGAWRNYFHWMCFALAKSYMASRLLDRSVAIVVPDYRDGLSRGGISYSETTWQQSLQFSGLQQRVTPLPEGLYRARKLHFFWTVPGQPTDIMYLSTFREVFDEMRRHAVPMQDQQRIYLARGRGVSSRIGDAPAAILADELERFGFRTTSFEGADLRHQISVFASAQQVVSPHGAGLTNSLFHPGGLRVLEMNRVIEGETAFRPWFYVTSAIRGHRYLTLDSQASDFSAARVAEAVATLGEEA